MTASKSCEGSQGSAMDASRSVCIALENLHFQEPHEQATADATMCEGCDSNMGKEITKWHQGQSAQVNDFIALNRISPHIAGRKSDLFFRRDEDGDTLLHLSILVGDEPKTFQIIQMAASLSDLNIPNNLFQTALHLAVLTRQSRTVRRLISAGAGVDAQDHNGNTPLHIACALGYSDIVQQLLKPVTYEETLHNHYSIPYQRIPRNMNLRNYSGFTCLHLAIVNEHINVLALLLEEGVDIHFGQGKSGRSALHLASEIGNLEILALITNERDVDFERVDFSGLTPFQLAHGRQNYGVMSFLIHLGVSAMVVHPDEDSDIDLGS